MNMNKRIRQSAVLLVTLLLLSFLLTFPCLVKDASAEIDAVLQISPGIRLDNLDWSIADIDGHPDVLSELHWTNLTIMQIKAAGDLIIEDKF